MKKLALVTAFISAISLGAASIAYAEAGGTEGGQSIGQAASDPTASLMSFQLNDWYTSNFHNLPGETSNNVVLRAAIPFKTGNLNHIFRATVPIITDHPALSDGLSDISLFDLVVFNESWGRWGVGPVALFPTGGSKSGTEKWAAGPAVGFTMPKGKLLLGVFNQNLFTYAGDDKRTDVDVSIIQPIVNYSLGNGWSVAVSDMNITYDWEASRWSSLPLGGKISKLVKFDGTPIQFSAQYEHDFADDGVVGPEDIFRFTMKVLMPSGGRVKK